MYRLVHGIFYLISLLPLPILYGLSEFAFLIIYRIIGYRKDVVLNNLSIAFPEKSQHERNIIAKKFYRNFTDSFIETIKLFSASDKFIRKHFTGDFSILNELYKKHQKAQIHSGHNFNWEYANVSIPIHMDYKLITVYMPIGNKIFERLFKKMRSRTGTILVPATNLRNSILPYRNEKYAIALVADQNPGDPKNAVWFNFFSKPAPFVKAPESGARRGNTPVVFCHFTKWKRGHYHIHFKLASEFPATTRQNELTGDYVKYLMDSIREQPDMYLWSHRRWKWEWKPEYGIIN